MIRMLLLLMITSVISKPQIPKTSQTSTGKMYRSEAQQIKLNEKQIKNQVAIQNTNYQSYNFVLNKTSYFIIQQEETQQIKAVFDVLWKQNNVYLQAAVSKEEEVSLIIEDQNKLIVINKTFFTGTGFNLNLIGSKAYKLTFKENGNYTKIVMMHLSKKYKASNQTAKLKQMVVLESKLLIVQQKLTNSLKLASTGLLIEQKLHQETLKKSYLYCYFQIFQVFFILLVSCMQIKILTNLLKSDNIV